MLYKPCLNAGKTLAYANLMAFCLMIANAINDACGPDTTDEFIVSDAAEALHFGSSVDDVIDALFNDAIILRTF